VTSSKSCSYNIYSHTAAGPGYKPNLFLGH
jgi:hypothetical protein